VRVLSNTSTGRTGAGLATHFAEHGHEVVYLRARTAAPATGCREETFLTFADLDAALARLLGAGHFDAVIHAAAVGDFGIESVAVGDRVGPPGAGKLESGAAPVTLHLRPQPKLVDSLRARSRNPALRVAAFKLTNGAAAADAAAAVRSLFTHSEADWVVHNDLAERGPGGEFPATVHARDGAPAVRCATRAELAAHLEMRLAAAIPLASSPTPSRHAALP
jgi:phosphopantothenoylcysteine synthetase/decarboxylase